MGADLYRKSNDPERLAAIAELDRREEDGENIHDPESGKPTWGQVMNAEGWYFRDSYNGSSLFQRIDMSWWRDLGQYLGPNGDGNRGERPTDDAPDSEWEAYGSLYPAGIRRLAAEVRSRSELLMYNCRDLPDVSEPYDDPVWGKGCRDLDKQYFSEKFDRFLNFLDTTAEAGDTIYCSV